MAEVATMAVVWSCPACAYAPDPNRTGHIRLELIPTPTDTNEAWLRLAPESHDRLRGHLQQHVQQAKSVMASLQALGFQVEAQQPQEGNGQ